MREGEGEVTSGLEHEGSAGVVIRSLRLEGLDHTFLQRACKGCARRTENVAVRAEKPHNPFPLRGKFMVILTRRSSSRTICQDIQNTRKRCGIASCHISGKSEAQSRDAVLQSRTSSGIIFPTLTCPMPV